MLGLVRKWVSRLGGLGMFIGLRVSVFGFIV